MVPFANPVVPLTSVGVVVAGRPPPLPKRMVPDERGDGARAWLLGLEATIRSRGWRGAPCMLPKLRGVFEKLLEVPDLGPTA